MSLTIVLSDPLVGERLKDPSCVGLMISWDLGARLGDVDWLDLGAGCEDLVARRRG